MLLLTLLLLSIPVSHLYGQNLRRSVNSAPSLNYTKEAGALFPKVSVIVPAYNEAENIQGCLTAILQSTALSSDCLEVWMVDDRSTDETLSLATTLQQDLNDPRLQVIAGKPRPPGENWAGKNWACVQGVEAATGDFLLFLDADVRLKPGAIETVIQTVEQEAIDLLTCVPALVCGCFAEWLVQPLMFNHLAVCFNFAAVNDPTTSVAFAAGPFMCFRRSAYEKIGGHQGVAGQIVEDVELAKQVKKAGLKLCFCPGPGIASVRMYRSWTALWEGWTKNLYLGANRSWGMMFYMAAIFLIIYPIPWVALASLLIQSLPISQAVLVRGEFSIQAFIWGLSFLLTGVGIWQQYQLRQIGQEISECSTRYWGWGGIGGILLAAIALGSAIKTETGWGWTWRGRPLKLPG